MIKENNMADNHLVVGSIEVLGDLTSGTTKEIKKTIEAVKAQALSLYRQQNNWWEKLSDDGVITPVEKNILYREMENIRRSEAAIYVQAEDLGYLSTAVIVTYINVYEDLRSYLYTDLRLFDDMNSDTQLEDRTLFNQKFSNYYYWESFVIISINRSIIASLNFRVLESLEEEGEENEVALYKGGLYMWVDGAWKSITTGDYKGALTAFPDGMENAFFLAADNWTVTETLYINGEKLYVTSGGVTDELALTRQVLKGVIYYYEDGVWLRDYDERGYRYVAAFADVINVTGELPALFQDALDDLQDQIDDINTEIGNTNAGLAAEIEARSGQYTIIADDIVRIDDNILAIIDRVEAAESDIEGLENSKISHLPVYYGATDMPPSSPLEGDYFVYSGTTTATYTFSTIYRYHNNAWQELASNNTAYNSYYMMALEDLLRINEAAPGYFTQLFAQSFWTASASMTTLDVKTIYLRQYGSIQSDNTSYVRESVGTRIDSSGNIDANGDTHIAGKVAIGVSLKNAQGQYQPDFANYDVVIGGNVKVRGDIEATSLSATVQSSIDGDISTAASGAVTDAVNDAQNWVNQQSFVNTTGLATALTDYVTETALDDKGYQDADDVDDIVEGKGYQTADDVDDIVEAKGYQTASDVNDIVTSKGYITDAALADYAQKNQTSKVVKRRLRTTYNDERDYYDLINGIKYYIYDVYINGDTSQVAYSYPVAETGDNTNHGFLTIANSIGEGFTLLTSQPSDWSTNYKNYYTKDNNGIYNPVTGSSAPAFASDTYYSRSTANKFFTVSKEGLLQANNAIIWGTIYATDGIFTGTLQSENFSSETSGFQFKKAGDSAINGKLTLGGDAELVMKDSKSSGSDYLGIHSNNYNNTTCVGFNISAHNGIGDAKFENIKCKSLTGWKSPSATYSGIVFGASAVQANGIFGYSNIQKISNTDGASTVYSRIEQLKDIQVEAGTLGHYLHVFGHYKITQNSASQTVEEEDFNLITISQVNNYLRVMCYNFKGAIRIFDIKSNVIEVYISSGNSWNINEFKFITPYI